MLFIVIGNCKKSIFSINKMKIFNMILKCRASIGVITNLQLRIIVFALLLIFKPAFDLYNYIKMQLRNRIYIKYYFK